MNLFTNQPASQHETVRPRAETVIDPTEIMRKMYEKNLRAVWAVAANSAGIVGPQQRQQEALVREQAAVLQRRVDLIAAPAVQEPEERSEPPALVAEVSEPIEQIGTPETVVADLDAHREAKAAGRLVELRANVDAARDAKAA